MQLHHLTSIKKKKKRIGRGGKRGTFSGKGTKGQRSRSGHRIRPAIRDLIMRLPKRRGFANRTTSPKPFSFNLSDLVKRIKPLAKKEMIVDKNFLKEIGIVPSDYRGEIKLLGDGEINFAVAVKGINPVRGRSPHGGRSRAFGGAASNGIKISKGAKIKIEKAGGSMLN